MELAKRRPPLRREVYISGGPTILELRRNGIGHIYNNSPNKVATIDNYFYWRAEGKKLLIKPTIPQWISPIAPHQLCGAPGGCQDWQINTAYVVKPHIAPKYRNDPDRLYLEGGYLGVFTDLWLNRVTE